GGAAADAGTQDRAARRRAGAQPAHTGTAQATRRHARSLRSGRTTRSAPVGAVAGLPVAAVGGPPPTRRFRGPPPLIVSREPSPRAAGQSGEARRESDCGDERRLPRERCRETRAIG